MKIVCVGDSYVTSEMMEKGVKPFLKPKDELRVLFFGHTDRSKMRDVVKAIESMKRDEIPIPVELDSEIIDCDILIVHLCPVTSALLSKANKLKAILSCRGGLENIDVDAASAKGIVVTSNPAHNANAVAEYTIGLILCETRNIARSDRALKSNYWREDYPNSKSSIREIHDMTIGIVGFGSVGRLVAEKLSVFGCNIFVCDPFISESAYDFINYSFVDLHSLLRKSDVVTLHARSKYPIIGKSEFALMKHEAYLINTARSVLVDSIALKEAMLNHQIMGAAIDVFETEPNISEFYKKFDNITITNHRGGDTINSYKDAPSFAIQNYIHYLNGERMRFWVNKRELMAQRSN